METTLHHQLKDYFREPDAPIEVRIDRYRIDVVNGDRLMEIQRSGLASIRTKIENLLASGFKVDVVKPIVIRKRLIKLSSAQGNELERRWSPLTGSIFDLFDELLYFTRTFPHPQLRLLAPLISIEEFRYPGHGKRRRWRQGDFVVHDRQILELHETFTFNSATDLTDLIPAVGLTHEFDTGELADCLSLRRHEAQRIAYVMRKTGAFVATGKCRNSIRYRLTTKKEAKQAMVLKKADPRQLKMAQRILKQALAEHRPKAA